MKTRKRNAEKDLIPAVPDAKRFLKSAAHSTPSHSAALLHNLESVYKWLKSIEPRSAASLSPALSELLTHGFQQEQIWQQIELQNNYKAKNIGRSLKPQFGDDILNEDALHFVKRDQMKGAEERFEDEEEEEQIEDEGLQESDGEEEATVSSKFPSGPKSQVDDQFFHLSDMEAFLESEDRKFEKQMQGKDIENEFDLSQQDDGKDEGYTYQDFFDPPDSTEKSKIAQKQRKKVRFEEIEEEEEEEEEMEGEDLDEDEGDEKSSFELRQQRLSSKISSLEDENLLPKSWQMAGEVLNSKRPENALLEEHLDFEHATKTAPLITQETTEKLEDFIRQRIRDKAWDDVSRKVKPSLEAPKYRNELVLDEQKSKKSLAQVYEEEFIKQSQTVKEEKKNPKHEEIRKQMLSLFQQLDSLSNYHYAPKTPTAEVRVVNNMRSLVMEEVAPTNTSDATLLAPEQVKEPNRSELKSSSERTETDRKRERRHKKVLAKAKGERKKDKDSNKNKLEQLSKLGKIKRTKKAKEGTKSSEFFSKLQQRVSGEITRKRKSSDDTETVPRKKSAANYKL